MSFGSATLRGSEIPPISELLYFSFLHASCYGDEAEQSAPLLFVGRDPPAMQVGKWI